MSGTLANIVMPLVLSFAYLVLLTLLSNWAQSSERAERWVKRPLTFGLALGVYASTWTFYGSVGFATRYGYGFAAISLGVVLSCLAIPMIWAPLSRIVRSQRLSNVADLLAYRFQSRTVGTVVTLFLLAGLLPYVSLQLRAISDAALALAGGTSNLNVGACYTLLIIVFAASVGTHFAAPWRKQTGLLMVLAGETLCKVLALLIVGGHALYDALGGPSGLGATLEAHPELLNQLYEPVQRGTFPALMACTFVAAFMLPRQFHVAFVIQPSSKALRHATWTVPLILLFLNLPLPVLWVAGQQALPAGTSPDLYVLLASSSPVIRTIAFLGGVSAASSMILVSTIALGAMVVNHIWQPFVHGTALVERTHHVRRAVVLLVVALAFVLHMWLPRRGSLVDLGLVSFTAVLQLVPALCATLFWERGSRIGFLCGLAAGITSWVALVWLPLFGYDLPDIHLARFMGIEPDVHSLSIWISLVANSIAFILGSLWAPPATQEAAAAAVCRARPYPAHLDAPPESVQALEQRVAAVLDADTARIEVERARIQLGLHPEEQGVWPLLRLAERTQRNLAEALGPLRARMAVGDPTRPFDRTALLGPQLLLLEEHMANDTEQRTAIEHAYAFVLRALGDLPVGLCALDGTERIAVWNQALVVITQISRERALGAPVSALPAPFNALIAEARMGTREENLSCESARRTLRVHRSHFAAGALVIIEDLTEEKALRDSLAHHDRLTSLGQLAAGVAHEIGNPLSGLLMVANNLKDDLPSEDAQLRVAAITREAKRIEGIVRSLLTFCHRGTGETRRRETALSDIVDEAVQLVALGRPGNDTRITLELDSELQVVVDRQAIVQVIVNLVSNALDAAPCGTPVTLHSGHEPQHTYVDVEDQGQGVDPQVEPMLFTPFVTTKDPGRGTGLGLAVSLRIAQEHGGGLHYQRTTRGTTRFRLTLPTSTKIGTVP